MGQIFEYPMSPQLTRLYLWVDLRMDFTESGTRFHLQSLTIAFTAVTFLSFSFFFQPPLAYMPLKISSETETMLCLER